MMFYCVEKYLIVLSEGIKKLGQDPKEEKKEEKRKLKGRM